MPPFAASPRLDPHGQNGNLAAYSIMAERHQLKNDFSFAAPAAPEAQSDARKEFGCRLGIMEYFSLTRKNRRTLMYWSAARGRFGRHRQSEYCEFPVHRGGGEGFMSLSFRTQSTAQDGQLRPQVRESYVVRIEDAASSP